MGPLMDPGDTGPLTDPYHMGLLMDPYDTDPLTDLYGRGLLMETYDRCRLMDPYDGGQVTDTLTQIIRIANFLRFPVSSSRSYSSPILEFSIAVIVWVR